MRAGNPRRHTTIRTPTIMKHRAAVAHKRAVASLIAIVQEHNRHPTAAEFVRAHQEELKAARKPSLRRQGGRRITQRKRRE